MKKPMLVLTLALFFLSLDFLILWRLEKRSALNSRSPASSESEVSNIEKSKQIKLDMLNNLRLSPSHDSTLLEIHSQDSLFCQQWTQLTVYLAAEGVAVSGEQPLLIATSPCREQKFSVSLSQDWSRWNSPQNHKGDFNSQPENFYIYQILIQGPLGEMRISSAELEEIAKINELFTLRYK